MWNISQKFSEGGLQEEIKLPSISVVWAGTFVCLLLLGLELFCLVIWFGCSFGVFWGGWQVVLLFCEDPGDREGRAEN